MMMPANYSVIAENEMTYVTGGGVIANILPAVMTQANWKTFNTNLVKVIGNSFMKSFLGDTLGVLFGSTYEFGDVVTGIGDTLSSTATVEGKVTGTGVLRAALKVLGGMASVYTLGTADVGMIDLKSHSILA